MKVPTLTALISLSAPMVAPAQPPAATPNRTGMINPQFNAARPRATYPVPYGPPSAQEITKVLVRVHGYLAVNTPARLVDRLTGAEITDLTSPNPNATIERGAFNLMGYEWGVTYAGMLLAAEATGDTRFRDYAAQRLAFIAEKAPYFRAVSAAASTPFAPCSIPTPWMIPARCAPR